MGKSRNLAEEGKAAQIATALEKVKAKLAKVKTKLSALDQAEVENPDELANFVKKRQRLLKNVEDLEFQAKVLARSLAKAREEDRIAKREREAEIRKQLAPKIEKVLEEVKVQAVQFGQTYGKLRNLCEGLPGCNRLPGPVAAIAMAAIIEQHAGREGDPFAADARNLARLAGFTGPVSVDGEVKAVRDLLIGGENENGVDSES